jgi:WD40 repeat protein
VLEGHGNGVTSVAFAPEGRHVVSGSFDSTLRLREVASGQDIARLEGDFDFRTIALASDGKSLAGDRGGRVHLVDILVDASGKAAWLARRRMSGSRCVYSFLAHSSVGWPAAAAARRRQP